MKSNLDNFTYINDVKSPFSKEDYKNVEEILNSHLIESGKDKILVVTMSSEITDIDAIVARYNEYKERFSNLFADIIVIDENIINVESCNKAAVRAKLKALLKMMED